MKKFITILLEALRLLIASTYQLKTDVKNFFIGRDFKLILWLMKEKAVMKARSVAALFSPSYRFRLGEMIYRDIWKHNAEVYAPEERVRKRHKLLYSYSRLNRRAANYYRSWMLKREKYLWKIMNNNQALLVKSGMSREESFSQIIVHYSFRDLLVLLISLEDDIANPSEFDNKHEQDHERLLKKCHQMVEQEMKSRG